MSQNRSSKDKEGAELTSPPHLACLGLFGGGGVGRASPEAHVEPDHPESWHSWVDPPPSPGSIVVGPLEVVTGPNTRSQLSPVIPEVPPP